MAGFGQGGQKEKKNTQTQHKSCEWLLVADVSEHKCWKRKKWKSIKSGSKRCTTSLPIEMYSNRPVYMFGLCELGIWPLANSELGSWGFRVLLVPMGVIHA